MYSVYLQPLNIDEVLGVKTFTDLDEARRWADARDVEYGPESCFILDDEDQEVTRTATA